MTQAALRGADFIAYADDSAAEVRIGQTVAASRQGSRSMVYAYEREPDHSGHTHGCQSGEWRAELVAMDRHCQQLRAALDDDVRLVITADHGMLDIPATHRLIAEDEPVLMAGVSALAGEPRFRQLYVDQDRPERVAERWRDRLGDGPGCAPGTRPSTTAGSGRWMRTCGSGMAMSWSR